MKKPFEPVAFEKLEPGLALALDERLAPEHADDGALIERVRRRVMAPIQSEIKPLLRTVRASDGGWQQVSPGVEQKVLWDSGGARSWMVRLAAGAVVAGHIHPMDEECVVLEGTLKIGDLLLKAGDFHVGRIGSVHETTTSETGALVYLRGALAAEQA